jgi:hypothetical protein
MIYMFLSELYHLAYSSNDTYPCEASRNQDSIYEKMLLFYTSRNQESIMQHAFLDQFSLNLRLKQSAQFGWSFWAVGPPPQSYGLLTSEGGISTAGMRA